MTKTCKLHSAEKVGKESQPIKLKGGENCIAPSNFIVLMIGLPEECY